MRFILLLVIGLLTVMNEPTSAHDGDEFTLTQTHVSLLRRALIAWNISESGAPMVFPAAPYGSEDPLRDIAAAANERRWFNGARLREIHRETEYALAVTLRFGQIAPGPYRYENHLAGRQSDFAIDILTSDDAAAPGEWIDFELTEQHIALLREASVVWEEDVDASGLGGVPGIDPKRPYGDMTYFEFDMTRALGIELPRGENGYFLKPDRELSARLQRLHREMQSALQVFLLNADIPLGAYRRENYVWEAR